MYLLDNGRKIVLWIGLNTPPEILQSVFGVSSFDGIDPLMVFFFLKKKINQNKKIKKNKIKNENEKTSLPVLDTSENKIVHEFINYIRTTSRHRFLPFEIIKHRDRSESMIIYLFIYLFQFTKKKKKLKNLFLQYFS